MVGLKSSSRFCCCFISDSDEPSSPASFGKNPSSTFMIQSIVCVHTTLLTAVMLVLGLGLVAQVLGLGLGLCVSGLVNITAADIRLETMTDL